MTLSTTSHANERPSELPYIEHVQGRILREASALDAEGYIPSHKASIGQTGRTQTRRYVLRLARGTTYALIAGCDQDCEHVELTIFDSERQQLSQSVKRSDVIVFAGAPEQNGLYEVEVKLPGCRQASCHAGLLVMQKGGSIPADGVLIAAGVSGPSPSPNVRDGQVASARFGMERRVGNEIVGMNYREIRNTSLGDCEQRCLADERCLAIEYYHEQQSCGLFDDTPNLRRARSIDASLKRSAVR